MAHLEIKCGKVDSSPFGSAAEANLPVPNELEPEALLVALRVTVDRTSQS